MLTTWRLSNASRVFIDWRQLWDRDLFKFNDHIAEGQLDLGPYFIKAYKTRDTVKLFPTLDPKMEEMRKADVSTVCLGYRYSCIYELVSTVYDTLIR